MQRLSMKWNLLNGCSLYIMQRSCCPVHNVSGLNFLQIPILHVSSVHIAAGFATKTDQQSENKSDDFKKKSFYFLLVFERFSVISRRIKRRGAGLFYKSLYSLSDILCVFSERWSHFAVELFLHDAFFVSCCPPPAFCCLTSLCRVRTSYSSSDLCHFVITSFSFELCLLLTALCCFCHLVSLSFLCLFFFGSHFFLVAY